MLNYQRVPWYSPVGNEVYHDPSLGWRPRTPSWWMRYIQNSWSDSTAPWEPWGKGRLDLGETPWKMYNPNVLMINIYQGILRYIWICWAFRYETFLKFVMQWWESPILRVRSITVTYHHQFTSHENSWPCCQWSIGMLTDPMNFQGWTQLMDQQIKELFARGVSRSLDSVDEHPQGLGNAGWWSLFVGL